MNNIRTFNEFLHWVSEQDKIHSHMMDLSVCKCNIDDELTLANLKDYLAVITCTREYCEDTTMHGIRYIDIPCVEEYLFSLAGVCKEMMAAIAKEKPQGTPSS